MHFAASQAMNLAQRLACPPFVMQRPGWSRKRQAWYASRSTSDMVRNNLKSGRVGLKRKACDFQIDAFTEKWAIEKVRRF